MTEKRIEKLKSYLGDGEAVIITSEPNRLYFTGFNSSAGYLAVTRSRSVFIMDFRYFEKAKAVIQGSEVILQNKLWEQLGDFFKSEGIKTVYTETAYMTVDTVKLFEKRLPDFNISRENKISELILKQRYVKSAEEIALIKRAQEMTDKTFSYILGEIDIGKTEREIMLQMEFFMRGLGSEGVSFDFIVVSGKNSSLPHGAPTDKKIEKGDFVTMDFGAAVGGYRSDMTRTVAVGAVTEEQEHIYNTVLSAQEAALKAIKPGVVCRDIDKISRDIIRNAGYGECFGHGLGHSVGIEIHESPAFNTTSEAVLESGIVMTVEPGIYLENKFGVRIEDMVVVNRESCENITASPKNLIIL